MRGPDERQAILFSYRSIEDRIPPAHPLRALRRLVDPVLIELSPHLQALYSAVGRPSIPKMRANHFAMSPEHAEPLNNPRRRTAAAEVASSSCTVTNWPRWLRALNSQPTRRLPGLEPECQSVA